MFIVCRLRLVTQLGSSRCRRDEPQRAFVDPADPIAPVDIEGSAHLIDSENYERACEQVRAAFIVESLQSFEQDPRFGIIALSEVGQRALSPAANDPRTAMQVASLVTILLVEMQPKLVAKGVTLGCCSEQPGQDTR